MVGTILPVVYGARSEGKIAFAHWLHLVGAAVGAAAMGTAISLLGAAMHLAWPPAAAAATVIAGAIALTYSLRELQLAPVPMPQFHRQVPTSWRYRYRPNVFAFMYGIGLGVGIATFVRVATLYVVLAWSFLVGNPLLGFVAMLPFGLMRGAPVVWFGERLHSIEEGFAATTLLNRWELVVHVINGLLLSWAGASLLAMALKLTV